jgi:ubiquinone/menaquinone biosynthesis C-methylase UbiE
MAVMARERRIKVYEGYAENFPFEDESFDFILMITLLCFLPDPFQALCEAARDFKSQGQVPPGPPGPAMAERAGLPKPQDVPNHLPRPAGSRRAGAGERR